MFRWFTCVLAGMLFPFAVVAQDHSHATTDHHHHHAPLAPAVGETAVVPYPDSLVFQYLSGCEATFLQDSSMKNMDIRKYCSCTWTKITQEIPNPEQYHRIIKDGGIDALMSNKQDIFISCFSEAHSVGTYIPYTQEFDENYKNQCYFGVNSDTITFGKHTDPEKYCGCMLQKLKMRFPSLSDAMKAYHDAQKNGTVGELFIKERDACLTVGRKDK
jgi:hypothetical protein